MCSPPSRSTGAGWSGAALARVDGQAEPGAGHSAGPGVCVGIVIALPEPLATELRGWRASFGDERADVVPAHITLVTTTSAPDWESTLAHVRHVVRSEPPFEIKLNGSGTFRPLTPVVYLKVEEGVSECMRLHRKLQAGPLARQLEFPFQPHVTVAHAVGDARLDEAARVMNLYRAGFPVRSIGVYEHDSAGSWNLQEELNLGGQDDNPLRTGS